MCNCEGFVSSAAHYAGRPATEGLFIAFVVGALLDAYCQALGFLINCIRELALASSSILPVWFIDQVLYNLQGYLWTEVEEHFYIIVLHIFKGLSKDLQVSCLTLCTPVGHSAALAAVFALLNGGRYIPDHFLRES